MPKCKPKHFIPVSTAELTDLIHRSPVGGKALEIVFGVGGAAIEWDGSEPMPWYLEQLGLMRGVLNENCEGAGI